MCKGGIRRVLRVFGDHVKTVWVGCYERIIKQRGRVWGRSKVQQEYINMMITNVN